MKTSYAIGLVATSVLITAAIEESRISSLRSSLKVAEKAISSKQPDTGSITASNNVVAEQAPPVRTKSSPEPRPVPPPKAGESDDESFEKTARKMWDNPAGKSMMNQGAKMAVAMMYQDFVDGLKLSKEEGDYLKNLLGKDVTDQQELGMKMMGATPEERKALADELSKRGKDNEAEIKKFLNNDEDFKAFNDYKNHLPEHQQLDGIRATMSSKGVSLDAETETRLADAMYHARTQSSAPDLSGPAGMDELAKGNIVETYEKSWDKQQAALQAETGKFLNDAQMAAFQEYQKQAKEMQLMGLKMAQKMMPGMKDGAK